MGLAFAAFFSFTYSQGIVRTGTVSLDGAIFYLSLSIALFVAYVSTGQVFLLEKKDGVIETLMCAPVSLRQIWAGKTVAGLVPSGLVPSGLVPSGLVPSWLVAIFAALLLLTITSVQSGAVLVPGLAIIVHMLVAVPVFIAAFVGLVGFGQLLLGMRENRLLNFLLFVPAFAALYGSGFAVASGFTASWLYVAIILAVSALLLGMATYLTRYLSRERIVTTIG